VAEKIKSLDQKVGIDVTGILSATDILTAITTDLNI